MNKAEMPDTNNTKMLIYFRKTIKDSLVRKTIAYIVFILKIGVMYTAISLSIANKEIFTFIIALTSSICLCCYEISKLEKNINIINSDITEALNKINEYGIKKTSHTKN